MVNEPMPMQSFAFVTSGVMTATECDQFFNPRIFQTIDDVFVLVRTGDIATVFFMRDDEHRDSNFIDGLLWHTGGRLECRERS